MAVIYLKHFLHGTKVATLEQEAVYDESRGWVRYTLGEPAVVEPVSQLDVKRKYTRRPTMGVSEGI